MKTDKKALENCQVKLTVTLDAAEVAPEVKSVERVFMREVRIPGFRPGKAPLELVRKNFADGIKQEVDRAIVSHNYKKATDQAGLDMLEVVNVEPVKRTPDGAEFTMVVEVRPTFKLPGYKGLKIAANDVKVADSDVNEQVARLRAAYATYEDAKEGDVTADGDFVQIDYTGTIDGKSILEFAPEAKVVASGTGFWVQIEEGRFLKEILDAVTGMKIGETKEGVKAKFDKDAAPKGLEGKKAEYTITLKAFRKRILPDDATFAKKAEAESVEALTAKIRGEMEKHAISAESQRRENEAVELLLKKVDFDVPQMQVRRAMDAYLNGLAQRAQYAGIGQDYFEKNQEQILKDAEENAKKQVRLWYILEAIAKEEKIEAKDDDLGKKVIEFVLANSKS